VPLVFLKSDAEFARVEAPPSTWRSRLGCIAGCIAIVALVATLILIGAMPEYYLVWLGVAVGAIVLCLAGLKFGGSGPVVEPNEAWPFQDMDAYNDALEAHGERVLDDILPRLQTPLWSLVKGRLQGTDDR
jgi:hypothetical protein